MKKGYSYFFSMFLCLTYCAIFVPNLTWASDPDWPFYSRGLRGFGARWPFEWDLTAARSRCEKANPDLGCEQIGAIIYPKCKKGYESYGIAGLDCKVIGYTAPNIPPAR